MTINTHLASDPASPLAALLERARQQRLPLGELFQYAEAFNAAGQRAVAASQTACREAALMRATAFWTSLRHELFSGFATSPMRLILSASFFNQD